MPLKICNLSPGPYITPDKALLHIDCMLDIDTQTHTHPTHAHSQENEDYQYVTTQPRTLHYAVSRQTEDVMRLGAIQPRSSPYTVNRGHALNSFFASFSSSHTPLSLREIVSSAMELKFGVFGYLLTTHVETNANKMRPQYSHTPCGFSCLFIFTFRQK